MNIKIQKAKSANTNIEYIKFNLQQLKLFVNNPPNMSNLKLNSGINKKRIYTEHRNFNILKNKLFIVINYNLSGKMIGYKIKYNPSQYVGSSVEFKINKNREIIVVTNVNSHLSHDSKKGEDDIYFILDGKFKRNVYSSPDIVGETTFNYIYTKLGDELYESKRKSVEFLPRTTNIEE